MRRAFARLAWLCLGMDLGCGFNPAVDGPPAGNPEGECKAAVELYLEDTSKPDHLVGSGTPESCTGKAFIEAVEQGGIITFNCGPDPVTIHQHDVARLLKPAGSKIVIDGGGKIALTSEGRYQSLIFDPCRSDFSSPPNCGKEPTARLTLQNLTFADNGTYSRGYGGGAVSVSDGLLTVVNCRFFNNACESDDSEGCGGAINISGYHKEVWADIVNSTFGGSVGLGNMASNGGALAVADASVSIRNSVFSDNVADPDFGWGTGGGQLGNGVGGAIFATSYQKQVAIELCGVRMNHNRATGVGGAIYFVGTAAGFLHIRSSVIVDNASRVEAGRYPGIFTTDNIFVRTSLY